MLFRSCRTRFGATHGRPSSSTTTMEASPRVHSRPSMLYVAGYGQCGPKGQQCHPRVTHMCELLTARSRRSTSRGSAWSTGNSCSGDSQPKVLKVLMSKVGRGGCRRHQNRLDLGKNPAGGTAMICPSGIYDTQSSFCITFDERAESPQLNTPFSSGVAAHLGTLLARRTQ